MSSICAVRTGVNLNIDFRADRVNDFREFFFFFLCLCTTLLCIWDHDILPYDLSSFHLSLHSKSISALLAGGVYLKMIVVTKQAVQDGNKRMKALQHVFDLKEHIGSMEH